MGKNVLKLAVCAALFSFASGALAEDKMPLKTDVPRPLFVGSPMPNFNLTVPNLEPRRTGRRPDFLVPIGTVNLAKGKKVTASDSKPAIGTLNLITDGDKEGDEGSWVEFGTGKQWVQIDLEKAADIYAIMVWHFHSQDRVYFDVVVQVSNDPTFEKDVTTIFDNTVGTGKDLAYIESYEGKLIDAKGVKA